MQKLSVKEMLGMIAVALLFLGASYGSERFASTLSEVVENGGILSSIFYILILIGIVLTPFASTLPLVPVAVVIWGNLFAGILTLTAWGISAFLAIIIARKIGRRLVVKVVPFRYIKEFGAMVPKSNILGGVTMLAILGAPIDIVSYAVGLFTSVKPISHALALMVGAIPFIFFLTFTATLPIVYQAYIVGFMIIIWFIVYSRLKQRSNMNNGKSQNEQQKLIQ
jgi:uncharacterized membrane protein YdjX (TVP38/TMEM64 family)